MGFDSSNRLLRLALAVGVLLAGAGVFYHYVVYLPHVDEQKRADARARDEARTEGYSRCMQAAREQYDSDWADTCKSVAQSNAIELKNCLRDRLVMSNQFMGAEYCKRKYGEADASPNCTLPGKRADAVNDYYKAAKATCAAEARLGVAQ